MKKKFFNKIYKMLSIKVCIVLNYLIISISQNSCNFSGSERKGDVIILDVRNNNEPEVNLASHKKYDVEVYRSMIMGSGYNVRYYQNENDSLRSHKASYMTDVNFDKAAYHWLSDTCVLIRLYNTVTKKEKLFKVFGHGANSGMSD